MSVPLTHHHRPHACMQPMNILSCLATTRSRSIKTYRQHHCQTSRIPSITMRLNMVLVTLGAWWDPLHCATLSECGCMNCMLREPSPTLISQRCGSLCPPPINALSIRNSFLVQRQSCIHLSIHRPLRYISHLAIMGPRLGHWAWPHSS